MGLTATATIRGHTPAGEARRYGDGGPAFAKASVFAPARRDFSEASKIAGSAVANAAAADIIVSEDPKGLQCCLIPARRDQAAPSR